MNKITDIEQLKGLAVNEKFYMIHNGDCTLFYFACAHPYAKYNNSIVAIAAHSHRTAVVIDVRDVNDNKKKTFLTGSYDSIEVG